MTGGEAVAEALARAEALRREGRHEEGIALLLDALRHGEAKAQVLFRLGILYFERGDLPKAEYAFRRATEEDPHHASAFHNLGVVYRRQGKIAQSVKMIKKAQWLELRYPRRGALPPEGRAAVRRARWVALLPLLVVGLLLALLLLRRPT
ncbi:MAG: tetratricopeptide repeat protein [Candidatus Bipolaricaulota bacterium]|nr:tetratricopeptide repeat protein [Candidatus Bipolaricaulota bacterium]